MHTTAREEENYMQNLTSSVLRANYYSHMINVGSSRHLYNHIVSCITSSLISKVCKYSRIHVEAVRVLVCSTYQEVACTMQTVYK